MSVLPKPVTSSKPGANQAGTWLNLLRDFVRRIRLRPGRGYRLKETPDGTYLELDIDSGVGGGPATPTTIFLMRLVSVGYDTLTCLHPTSGANVYVAKIQALRNSNASEVINGSLHNFTYDASFVARVDTSIGEQQIVLPRYHTSLPFTFITAAPIAPASLQFDPDEPPVTVNFIEVGERAWAATTTN